MQNQLNLKSLKLINYRCFDTLNIEFDENITVLIGSNGGGKTGLLDAVAIALGPFVGAFDFGVGKHFTRTDIRLAKVRETESVEMEYADGGVILEAKGWIPGESSVPSQIWRRRLSSPKNSKTTIKEAKNLIEYGKALQSKVKDGNDAAILPVIAYYGTGRLWHQRHLHDKRKKLGKSSRTIGYFECLDPASSYKLFANWFEYWSKNAKNEKLKAFEKGAPLKETEFDRYIKSVAGAVDVCLHVAGWKGIKYSMAAEEIVVEHDAHGQLPVTLLSDGIRNMIGMVADIAFRATKLNPQLGEKASLETPGVVLIDEVDMHLHPEWQQVVLRNLREAFPRIQFIATTHSPQVLSSIKRSNIRVLSRNVQNEFIAEQPIEDTYGRDSGLVMHEAMEVDPSPPIGERQALNRLSELVDSGQYECKEANELFSELKSKLGKEHPHLLRLEKSKKRQEALKAL